MIGLALTVMTAAPTPQPSAHTEPSVTDWISTATAVAGLVVAGWSAFFALVTAAVAIVAAVYAARQWQEAKTTRENIAKGEVERLQPYIQVWAAWSDTVDGQVLLYVKNFGPTTATNVTVTMDEPVVRAIEEEHPFHTVKIPDFAAMPPGFEWRTWVDRWEKRSPEGLPMRYEGTVRYEGYNGAVRSHPVVLDLAAINAQVYAPQKRLPELIESVDGVAKAIHEATDSTSSPGGQKFRDPASVQPQGEG